MGVAEGGGRKAESLATAAGRVCDRLRRCGGSVHHGGGGCLLGGALACAGVAGVPLPADVTVGEGELSRAQRGVPELQRLVGIAPTIDDHGLVAPVGGAVGGDEVEAGHGGEKG